MIRTVNESCCPGHSKMRRFQQPERVVGTLPSMLVKKTQQRRKKKTQNKGKSSNGQGLGSEQRRKKKESYELYLLCLRYFTAFASVCGYLFTKGLIAGSARSRQLPASRRSR